MENQYTRILPGLGFWKVDNDANVIMSSNTGKMRILVVRLKSEGRPQNAPTHSVVLERQVVDTKSGGEESIRFPVGLDLWENKTNGDNPQTYYSGRMNQLQVSIWPTRSKSKSNSPDFYVQLSQKASEAVATPKAEPAMAGAGASDDNGDTSIPF